MKKISLIIIVFASAFLVSANQAQALGLSPSRMLVTAAPGTEQTVSLDVINTENKDLNFSLQILGVRQNNEGLPVFLNNLDEAENWVKPDQSEIAVPAGQQGKVDFTIAVPAFAAPGSHYLGLAVQPSQAGGGGVGLSGQVVSLLFLQVSGRVDEIVEIRQWQPQKDVYRDKQLDFFLELANQGNIEVDLQGSLTVTGLLGRELAQSKLNLGNKLLAKTNRNLNSEVNLNEKLLLWPGLYQAQAKITYGRTNQVVSASTSFWYWPNWAWVMVIILGVGLFFLLKKFVFRRNR